LIDVNKIKLFHEIFGKFHESFVTLLCKSLRNENKIKANKMKLSRKALNKIDVLEVRLKLALLFKVTERRVSQMIKSNEPFSKLTSLPAVQLIQEETGLTPDEILVADKIAA
jgi:hypothetical protein